MKSPDVSNAVQSGVRLQQSRLPCVPCLLHTMAASGVGPLSGKTVFGLEYEYYTVLVKKLGSRTSALISTAHTYQNNAISAVNEKVMLS